MWITSKTINKLKIWKKKKSHFLFFKVLYLLITIFLTGLSLWFEHFVRNLQTYRFVGKKKYSLQTCFSCTILFRLVIDSKTRCRILGDIEYERNRLKKIRKHP